MSSHSFSFDPLNDSCVLIQSNGTFSVDEVRDLSYLYLFIFLTSLAPATISAFWLANLFILS